MIRCSGISDEAGQPIDLQIKAHKELGWDFIELRNIDGVNLTDVDDRKFDEIHHKILEAGLRVSCFASQLANWSRPITNPFDVDVQELTRAIPRMQKMRTKYIRAMSYPNDKEAPLSDKDWRKEVVRRLRQLTKMAADGGIVIVHENCSGWGGENPRNNLELLQEIDSPAFKQVFDSGNCVPHKLDSWEYYQAVKPYTVYVHIKDAVWDEDLNDVRYTLCGDGAGYTEKILEDLKISGYEGLVSIEPHTAAIVHSGSSSDPEILYQKYIEYGQKLMTLLQEVGAA